MAETELIPFAFTPDGGAATNTNKDYSGKGMA